MYNFEFALGVVPAFKRDLELRFQSQYHRTEVSPCAPTCSVSCLLCLSVLGLHEGWTAQWKGHHRSRVWILILPLFGLATLGEIIIFF